MPKHRQMVFELSDGRLATVDADIYDLMIELRRLGVKTQFSCQGDKNRAAYFLADRKSLKPVLKKLNKLHRGFKSAHKTYEFDIFMHDGEDHILHYEFNRGTHPGYRIERTYSPTYGARIIVRWPSIKTKAFVDALRKIPN